MWQWKGALRAMGPLTQPHPWLRDPEWAWHSASLALVVYQFHQHLLCFSKEATKKQITEQKSDPLDWLHSWMFWEYDPHLWKNSIFCNFTRARECIIIVEDLENHLQRGSRNCKEKKDDWGRWAASVKTWAFSKEIPQEGKQRQLCDLRQETLATMVSTPF